RCGRRRCIFWRINVSSRQSRLEGGASGVGRTTEGASVRLARHAVADITPRAIWRDRSSPSQISSSLRERHQPAAQLLVESATLPADDRTRSTNASTAIFALKQELCILIRSRSK